MWGCNMQVSISEPLVLRTRGKRWQVSDPTERMMGWRDGVSINFEEVWLRILTDHGSATAETPGPRHTGGIVKCIFS